MDEMLHVNRENLEKYVKSVVGEKYEIECGCKSFLKIISFTFFSTNQDFVEKIKKKWLHKRICFCRCKGYDWDIDGKFQACNYG